MCVAPNKRGSTREASPTVGADGSPELRPGKSEPIKRKRHSTEKRDTIKKRKKTQ